MKRLKVAVVLGGRSVEHPVSCASGAGVIAALEKAGFSTVPIGITQAGEWVTVDTSAAKLALEDGALPQIAAETGTRVSLPSEPGATTLVVTDAAGATADMTDVDVVFPVLHGTYGEDGTIQGLLEMAEVPYVGSGVLASAASMDKEFAKRLLLAEGIPVAPYAMLRAGGELSESERERLGLPVFVKPARAGSSVGITKVTDWQQLPEALEAARTVDTKMIIESGFVGARELECGVLASRNGAVCETTQPFEVLGTNDEGWFDFDAKYFAADPYNLAPELPDGVASRIRELAAQVFTTLDCSDLARVDFFLAPDGEVYVNEINTMPGMTPKSGVPLAWRAAGVDYPELVARLVEMAAERGVGPR